MAAAENAVRRNSLDHSFERVPIKFAVGVDDSKCSLNALKFIDSLASKDDHIHLFHAPDEDTSKCIEKRFQEYMKSKANRYSFDMIKQSQSQGKDNNEKIMHYINQFPDKKSPDFLVTGKHGATHEVKSHKPSHEKFGSLSDVSLRKIRCTSIFVPRFVDHDITPDCENNEPWIAVVGVDGSTNSEHAFDMAAQLLQTNHHHTCKKEKNMLYVVHVKATSSLSHSMDEKQIKKRFSEICQLFTEKTGIKSEFVIIDGLVVSKPLCAFAEDKKAQLIFVGEDGMKNTIQGKRFLGSVSDKVVQIAHCAVVVSHVNEFYVSGVSKMQKHET